MKMYQYDNDGFLTDPAGYTPQINTVNQTPLIRARSTELIPPIQQDNQVIQYANGAWSVIPDFRGLNYYLPDGTSTTIEAVNITPPANHLTSAPPPTDTQLRAIEREWARNELALTDQIIFADSPYSMAHQTLIKTYRAALRNPAREATANYPAQSWRPVFPGSVSRPD